MGRWAIQGRKLLGSTYGKRGKEVKIFHFIPTREPNCEQRKQERGSSFSKGWGLRSKVEEAVTVKAGGGRRQLQLLVAFGGKIGRCSYR